MAAAGGSATEIMLNSTHAKAHRCAAGGKGGSRPGHRPLPRQAHTTKVHVLVDGKGDQSLSVITPGQLGDLRAATALIGRLPPAQTCVADCAHDNHGFRSFLASRGTRAVVPGNRTHKHPYPFDRQAYRRRNLIERMSSRLKDFRRIATRYDKLAVTCDDAVVIAAMVIWWL